MRTFNLDFISESDNDIAKPLLNNGIMVLLSNDILALLNNGILAYLEISRGRISMPSHANLIASVLDVYTIIDLFHLIHCLLLA